MSPIPFNHVSLHAKKLKSRLLHRFAEIIDSGWYLSGPQNNRLEEALAFFLSTEYVTTVGSGHDALYLSLLSLHLDPGDEVLFPVNAYPTAFPICMTAATPIPVDCDENAQIDVKELKKKITKKTKAIIIVHLYGGTADMTAIQEAIQGKDITLIEDCAQAFGTTWLNKPVGTIGDIGCFSFYPTKNMGTLGDGGAICTRNKAVFMHILKAKQYGEESRYASEFVTGHSRLPELQAGILNVYLEQIDEDIKKRHETYTYYREQIKEKDLARFIRPLEITDGCNPTIHLFVVEATKRDALREYLTKKEIETHVHYPTPIHLLPAFSHLEYKEKDFPMAEHLSKRLLSLPFHPYLTTKQIDHILSTISRFYNG